MAELYFFRDGSGQHRASRAHQVPMEVARSVAEERGTKFAPMTTMKINSGVASWFGTFRHAVIRVESNEIGGPFPQAGDYYLVGLSVEDAKSIFRISNSFDE